MPSNEILAYDPPKVKGVADDDQEGYIPPELLQKGIEVVVPIWPVQSPDGNTDTLIVHAAGSGNRPFEWKQSYVTPINVVEFTIPIGPEYLIIDGVVDVTYQTRNYLGNPADSLPRKLTIVHAPISENLPEVDFPAKNDGGYLNCESEPPIWSGVEVKVPPLPSFCKVGDVCRVEWVGYLSPNGSGDAITDTYKRIDKMLLSDLEIEKGFSVTIEPFIPHLEPMKNKASAIANYSIYRGAKLLGTSTEGMVRIDRVIPGEPLPCGP